MLAGFVASIILFLLIVGIFIRLGHTVRTLEHITVQLTSLGDLIARQKD